jgi:type VI secretion system protein VasD
MAISHTPGLSLRRLPALLGAALLAAEVAAVALGCQKTPAAAPAPCEVQVVTLDIYAADNVNPNENGNPRPVVVKLYQLKSDMKLTNATYDDVLLREKEVLGEDVAKVDDVEVYPNDLVQVRFERIKEASHLAGVALFHSPKGTSWKTFYEFPLPPGEARCGGRGEDGGPPVADPHVSFFLESTKIDNGSQFDESQFPTARAIRRVSLPRKSAAPEGAGAAAAPAGGASK